MIYPSDIEQRFERRWAESRRTARLCMTELQVAANPLAAAGLHGDNRMARPPKERRRKTEVLEGLDNREDLAYVLSPTRQAQGDPIINVCAGSSPPYV
jgi:hypothetical protein